MWGLAALAFACSAAGALPPDPGDVPPPPAPLLSPSVPSAGAHDPAELAPATPARPATPQATVHKQAAPAFRPVDPILLGLLQGAGFCAASAIGVPCALAVPGGLCAACLVPAAAGYAVTWLGDTFGPSRAPAIAPVVAGYFATGFAALSLGTWYVAATGGGAFDDPTQVALYGGAAVAGLLALGATAVVPISYATASEPKRDGDDGSGFPGWFEAAHPRPMHY